MPGTKVNPPATHQALSDALLTALCDSDTIGIQVGHGYEGELYYVNDTFLTMVGYTRQEFDAGEISWRDLSPAEDAAIDAVAVNNMKTHKATPAFTKQYIHKDGHRVTFSMQPVLIPETEMDWICYMVVINP